MSRTSSYIDSLDTMPAEESSGIFDPVPALSTVGVCGCSREPAHDLEARVQRRLLNEPGLRFHSLSVHRLRNGAVCLEGVLSGSSIMPDISELISEIDGIDEVVNHLLVCQEDDG